VFQKRVSARYSWWGESRSKPKILRFVRLVQLGLERLSPHRAISGSGLRGEFRVQRVDGGREKWARVDDRQQDSRPTNLIGASLQVAMVFDVNGLMARRARTSRGNLLGPHVTVREGLEKIDQVGFLLGR